MPMPTLAPVSRDPPPPLDCEVEVEVEEAVDPVVVLELEAVDEAAAVVVEATVPADLLVDVGLKSFTYVMEPPAEAGNVLKPFLSADLTCPNKKRLTRDRE